MYSKTSASRYKQSRYFRGKQAPGIGETEDKAELTTR